MGIELGALADGLPVEVSIGDYDKGILASVRETAEKLRAQAEAAHLSKAKEVYAGFGAMSPEDQKVLLDVIHAETNPDGYKQDKLVEARLAQAARKATPEYDSLTADQQRELRYQVEDREAAEYKEFAARWCTEHPSENPSLTGGAGEVGYVWQVDVKIKDAWEERQRAQPDYISAEKFFVNLQAQYLANREKLFNAYPDLEKPFKDEFDNKPVVNNNVKL